MPPRTLAEKILSVHATGTEECRAGELVVCEADLILGTDGSTPMAIDYFQAMGGGGEGAPVAFPERVLLARDHYSPPTSPATLGFHRRMEAFAREHGVELLPVGGGISFQVALETGRVRAGDLVVGADSHTTSCGAVGAFATGIGSADLAGALLTGKVWLRVPESMRVVLEGSLPSGVGAKDVALEVVRSVGSEGAAYRAVEFAGPVADALPVEERFVLSNMAAEMGAKAGMFPEGGSPAEADPGVTGLGPGQGGLASDPGAPFTDEVRVDCSGLVPRVALPHQPANGVPVTQLLGKAIDWVFLGTCTGGRAHDLRNALRVLEAGGGIDPSVTVVVTPPSPGVREALGNAGSRHHRNRLRTLLRHNGPHPPTQRPDPLHGEPELPGPDGPGHGGHSPGLPGDLRRRRHGRTHHRSPGGGVMGRARRLGDRVNTDYIISSSRKKETLDPTELKAWLLESVDPDFAASVEDGDILVAGEAFGCGSAMEVAVTVVLSAGIRAVVARSFSRTYFRNAINNGLLPVECDTSKIREGDELTLRLEAGEVTVVNETAGAEIRARPLPPFVLEILNAGGLVPYLRAAGGFPGPSSSEPDR
jgi:3-isopropylmalate/(R)-2-methylmalate dehydratase large subunit